MFEKVGGRAQSTEHRASELGLEYAEILGPIQNIFRMTHTALYGGGYQFNHRGAYQFRNSIKENEQRLKQILQDARTLRRNEKKSVMRTVADTFRDRALIKNIKSASSPEKLTSLTREFLIREVELEQS